MKISESLRVTWLMEEFYLAESVLRQKKDQDEAEMMGSGSDYGIATAYILSPVKESYGNSR